MSPRLPLWGALALAAVAGGCGDTMISVSSDGRIDIVVTTSGSDLDTDGFSVTVDGGTAQFVAPGGTVTLTGLSQGGHSVLLGGLAENCRVDGSNPRTVAVGPDGRAQVTFDVRCDRATTGGFTIQVATTGDPTDPDGYALAVAGAGIRTIGVNATETFLGLVPGVHLVTLKDVDEPCVLTGGNPQPFTVVRGKTVLVRLTVACGPVV
jgi:hypothetical protein